MQLLQELSKEKLIHPPSWLPNNVMYATYTGSVSYGVSEDYSDVDIVGFCIPAKDIVFPHLGGELFGFDDPKPFNGWQEHHVKYKEKEYDFNIYNIVSFFKLCMNANPNMIDTLFTGQNCVIQSSQIGNLVRENRKLFLSKKAYHSFKGYAYAQKQQLYRERTGKRKELIEKFGVDTKNMYHLVRLILEVDQILSEGDLDLTRNKDVLKSIRAGQWSLEDVENFFKEKESYLERVYNNSTIPYKPEKDKIKKLLLECLEIHYGNIDNCIRQLDKYEMAIQEIKTIVEKI